MSNTTIRSTNNYEMFELENTNRDILPRRIRKKKNSLKAQGWIETQPMTVQKNGDGKYVILDGQTRFMAAQELGIAVYYAVLPDDRQVNIAAMNTEVGKWNAADYGRHHSKRGCATYDEVEIFAARHGLPLTEAAGMLGGTTWSNVRKAWMEGMYKIKDRDHAERIATLYMRLRDSIPGRKMDRSLRGAVEAVCRISSFDIARMAEKTKQYNEPLMVKYATREGALQALETIYNYRHRGDKSPLKVDAENAMRKRNVARKKD